MSQDISGTLRFWNLRNLKGRLMKMRVLLNRPLFIACVALAVSFPPAGAGGLAASPKTQGTAEVSPARAVVSVKGLDLSRAPTARELSAAGQLGGPLFATHELEDKARDEAARWAFGRAIEAWNRHEYPKAVNLFRNYLAEYPDSPWAGEAELHIGCDASYNGRASEAQAIFDRLIAKYQGQAHPGAQMLVNKARQRLASLMVERNDLDQARLEFRALRQESPDWRQRTYASHWLQRIAGFAAAGKALANCGAEALAYALEQEGLQAAAKRVRTNLPPTLQGHSLGSLAKLSAEQGIKVAGCQLSPPQLQKLPLPAIIQVRPLTPADSGHYWVLDRAQAGRLELFDPQSHRRFSQTPDELAREWTGRVLVFVKGGPLPGRRLAAPEMEAGWGACCGIPPKEDPLGRPDDRPPKPDPCAGGGAPDWSVNVINMNLFVTDTPLWYNPPIGPPVHISISYNSESAIAQYEPFGQKWQFNYGSYLVVDTAGTVTLFMPDGRRDVYAPDGAGGYARPFRVFNTLTRVAANHFELRQPDDTVAVYQIPAGTGSEQPFLTELRNAHGQKLTFGYDANVNLTTITDAQGQVTTLTYNSDGLVTNVADPFGRNATFEYDADGNLTRCTDMGGYWAGYTYDSDVYLTSITKERGTWSFLIQPADGIDNGENPYPAPGEAMYQNYRVTVTDPLGQSSEYQYDGYSSYSWHISPRDYVPWRSEFANNYKLNVPKTAYYFSEMSVGRIGAVGSVAFPAGESIYLEYDEETGNRTSVSDGHGNTWNYTYNTMGRVTSVQDPRGTATTLTYAANGIDLVGVGNGLGQIRLLWDAQHDLLSLADRMNNTTSYAYNAFGQLTALTDALGITNTYLYDANQRLSQIQRAGLTLGAFTYDAVGRVRTQTDATGLTLTNDYNDLNQLTRITYPDGKSASFAYSTCCPRILDSTTDRAGRTTTLVHDALNRLVQTINAESGVTQCGYDANNSLTALTDPNGIVTTLAYDLDNRLVRRTYADGRSVSFGYDDAGLLVARTNANGMVTTYTYDADYNLTNVAYSDHTADITNVYDSFNRLTQVFDALGTRVYTYDANGRVLSSTGPWPSSTITYQYDGLGRPTNVAVSPGRSVAFAYDAQNRLSQVQSGGGAFTYGYSGASPLVQTLSYPNGSSTTNAYDALGRPLLLATRKSTQELIYQFACTYGAQDLRDSVTTLPGPSPGPGQAVAATYRYNNLNQLVSSTAMPQALAYDNDGNLIQGYTPAGDLFLAAYDAEDRLSTLVYTNSGGVTFSNAYVYSASSLLSEWTLFTNGVLASDTRFVWSAGLPVQERDHNNTVTRDYVWGANLGGGIGGLLGLAQAGQNYVYVYDGRGNVAAVLDSSQNTAASYAYDPFGQVTASTGALNQPVQFSTKIYDPRTGLVYFGRRFYQPSTGRWLTRDRLGEVAGLNAYAFVHDDPLNRIDPLGLDDTTPGDWLPSSPTPLSPAQSSGSGDGTSLSLQGLGQQLSAGAGDLSLQLQVPYSMPGKSPNFSDLDLQLNYKFSKSFSGICDASTGQIGGDLTLGDFDLQALFGPQGASIQPGWNITPNINLQLQLNVGQGISGGAGVAGTWDFP